MEAAFEEELRGTDGTKVVETNPDGTVNLILLPNNLLQEILCILLWTVIYKK
ncbi:MAG: hypothetical protein ACLSCV_09575 [Acutalibacteraceae bacterium]